MHTHPTVASLALLTLAACAPAEAPGVDPGSSTTAVTTGPDPTTGLAQPDPTGTADPPTGPPSTGDPAGTSTTDASTTDAATTGALPGCGDGTLQAGEECDDGHGANDDSASCTLACKLNVCGDGLVLVGVEACDAGSNNNDTLYGGCRTDCSLADHCGDLAVQPPEECDLGKNNGTGLSELGGVPCDATCRQDAKLTFLSSEVYAVGDLGSASSADDRCRDLAEAAGLDNHAAFMAWISDAVSSPKTRFTPTTLPYVLLNGVRVANHTAQLLTTGPLVGITHTDAHEDLPYEWVWTGTAPSGARLDPPLDCASWQSGKFDVSARLGLSGVDPQDVDEWELWKYDHQWTSFKTLSCNKKYRLYCFEQ